MEEYISKFALVAEIERWIKHYKLAAKEFGDEGYMDNVLMEQCKARACERILSFINTLKVKEVDLQSEIDRVWDNTSDNFSEDGWKEFEEIAKHFFELGLKAQKGK